MNLDEAIGKLEQLLSEEREAIQQIDAERVAMIATEKEEIFSVLEQGGLSSRKDLALRFRNIVQNLRHNAVLLAHARDCIRDAIAAAYGDLSSGSMRTNSQAIRGTHISVTG